MRYNVNKVLWCQPKGGLNVKIATRTCGDQFHFISNEMQKDIGCNVLEECIIRCL